MKTVCLLGCIMGVRGKQASEIVIEGSRNSIYLPVEEGRPRRPVENVAESG